MDIDVVVGWVMIFITILLVLFYTFDVITF